MTFNLQNLFDTEHDEGKDDWEFLPRDYPGKKEACGAKPKSQRAACLRSDWTLEKLKLKMSQIQSLLQELGGPPDLLAVQEVENLRVLRRLGDLLGYEGAILEESFGERGVDVGLLFKTEKLEYLRHRARPMEDTEWGSFNSRSILGVYFNPRGNPSAILGVYVNHWPARMAPNRLRMAAAENLRSFLKEDIYRMGARDFSALAVGDFNTTDFDSPSPFFDVISRTEEKLFIDTLDGVENLENAPSGTYFSVAQKEWQFLDRVFITENMNSVSGEGFFKILPNSYRVGATQINTRDFRYYSRRSPHYGDKVNDIPFRHDVEAESSDRAGFSDHFPVEISIEIQ